MVRAHRAIGMIRNLKIANRNATRRVESERDFGEISKKVKNKTTASSIEIDQVGNIDSAGLDNPAIIPQMRVAVGYRSRILIGIDT